MTFEFGQVLQVLGTLFPIFLFGYGLHVQNQNRTKENGTKLDALSVLVQKHDKRTRRMKDALQQHVKMYHVGYGGGRPAYPREAKNARSRRS